MGWYKKSFGEDYLKIYAHRDEVSAQKEIGQVNEWLHEVTGGTVLDLCCGKGRHSLALAEFGFHVTGLDLSEVLLAEAKNRDEKGIVRWVRSDARRLPFDDGTFDAVVNLFTSFGYFDHDSENALVLLEMARVLRPGGLFVIDFLNAEHIRKTLVPLSVRENEELVIEEIRTLNEGFVHKLIRVTEKATKEVREYREQVRLYEHAEMKRMVVDAGLKLERVFGNFDGDEYVRDSSTRLILTGRRIE